jgi:hypothetical protein
LIELEGMRLTGKSAAPFGKNRTQKLRTPARHTA